MGVSTIRNSSKSVKEYIMKRSFIPLVSLILLVALITSCAPQGEPVPAQPIGAEADLKMTGSATFVTWTMEDLRGFPSMEVKYTNKDGITTTYTGVAISALLAEVGVESFNSLTLFAVDGYSAEVTADEMDGCEKCIVAFDDGSLRSVMPDLSSKLQVKDLVEIQINQ
jgi:hypothetical protein